MSKKKPTPPIQPPEKLCVDYVKYAMHMNAEFARLGWPLVVMLTPAAFTRTAPPEPTS